MPARELYEGVAIGGPLHGETLTSRFPLGFVLINWNEGVSGLYMLAPGNCFVYKHDMRYMRDSAYLRSVAEGNDYDVRAM